MTFQQHSRVAAWRITDPITREARDTVFGKGRRESPNGYSRAGLMPCANPGHGEVGFRRTDADRRPARVFRQPNDGPAPDREERAAAILASIENRRRPMPRPSERKEMVLRALLDGPKSNRELAETVGVTASVVSDVLRICDEEGLVERKSNLLSIGRETISRLTAAGRAQAVDLLEAA